MATTKRESGLDLKALSVKAYTALSKGDAATFTECKNKAAKAGKSLLPRDNVMPEGE